MVNPIGWCTSTINPITGCTNFNTQHCGDYCYAKTRMAPRLAGRFGYPKDDPFRPTLHEDKLWDILELPEKGTPKRIFLDSMSDWFCEGVPAAWVHHVLDVVDQVPQHHFLVLTKRPERIMDVLHCRNLPENLWLGVSVTCRADLWRISMLKESIPSATKRFISFEPLLGPVYQEGQKLGGVDWAIIGAQTGPGKVAPGREWVERIIDAADACGVPIFLKDNLKPYGPQLTAAQLYLAGKQPKLRQQFPEMMQ